MTAPARALVGGLVGALVVTGVMVAATWLRTDPDGASNAALDQGRATVPAASSAPGAVATASTALFRPSLTFDLHPIGPLEPAEISVTRITGQPEVVSIPSPFDRSMRLAGASSGICVAAPAARADSSIAFDMLLSRATGDGRLAMGVGATTTVPARGFSVDLASLDLRPGAWYRVMVTSDGSAAILTVAHRGGEAVLEMELAGDEPIASTSTSDSCLHVSLRGTDASVLVDNLWVG